MAASAAPEPALAALQVLAHRLLLRRRQAVEEVAGGGKHGRGLVPVDREPLGSPDVYGRDRLFVHLHLAGAPDVRQDAAVEALAGRPA